MHVPVLQVSLAVHDWPQLPQLASSPFTSVQMPLQDVWPAGHSQFPPVQIKPSAQALPHVPQFFGSAWRLRHDPLQLVRPPPHWVVHTPLLHTWFRPQPILQEPHRLGLDDKFAQVPVQSVSPAGHWQLPAQTLPPVQAVPQAPQ
jgi:hypothetical protein